MEGFLSTNHAILGFDIDTETGLIGAPPANVMGAHLVILSDAYKPGCAKVKLRDVQVPRGLCQRWMAASLYWKITLQGLGALLRFAGESDSYISRPEPDVWIAFWGIRDVPRVNADDELRRGRLFRGGNM